MIHTGRVSWFNLDKKFGLVALEDGQGDAFLHMSALKAAGYVSVTAGTTLKARVEVEQGRRRIAEITEVDVSTSHSGEPPPVMRKGQSGGKPNSLNSD